MLTTSHTAPARLRFALVVATVTALVLPQLSTASSYGWPVKPFFSQHPVRGFFGDPRIGEGQQGKSHSFHFGVDVVAADGTPVFATVSGRIVISPDHPQTISIQAGDGQSVFAYWHLVPSVRKGDRAVAYRTVLGHVADGWGHVHFAESLNGEFLNPLRPGAMAPYVDHTMPAVHAFSFERDGKAVGRVGLHGRFDLVAEAYDETPLAVPAPWDDRPVCPALVRWRIIGARRRARAWQTSADFTTTIPPASSFDSVYARWTRQNHPWRDGRYRFRLARSWDSRLVPDGRYRLEVVVVDSRGNTSRKATTFTVANDV